MTTPDASVPTLDNRGYAELSGGAVPLSMWPDFFMSKKFLLAYYSPSLFFLGKHMDIMSTNSDDLNTSQRGTKVLFQSIYCCLVDKSCPALCDPMDCSLPGFSVHWIPQARILEWVAISYSRGSS